MQRLLLDIFIQIGSRMVDTGPVGTGIIKVILLLPSSLRTQLHPVVVAVDQPGTRWVLGVWVSVRVM